jgi:hypothetical protein
MRRVLPMQVHLTRQVSAVGGLEATEGTDGRCAWRQAKPCLQNGSLITVYYEGITSDMEKQVKYSYIKSF